MKKLLALLVFLALAGTAGAQCSGTSSAQSCAVGSSVSQISTALTAGDGVVVTVAAGASNWSGGAITLPTTTGWTLICASAPLTVGASTSAPCTITAGGTVFSAAGFPNDNKLRRISGFTINQGSANFLTYLCTGGGCSGTAGEFRFDHNTVTLQTGGVALFGGDSVAFNLHLYGVMDHNIIQSAGSAFAFETISNVESGTTINSSPMGTGNNFFLENNTITMTSLTNSGSGCTDGWGSAFAVVFRYNTVTNCRVLTHGLGDGGGPENFEIYNNSITMNSGSSGSGIETCFRCIHDQGAGTMVVLNNTLTPFTTDDPSAIVFQNFRDCGNGPSCNEGNKPPACDGTVSGATYPGTTYTFSDGNRSPSTTWYGYPCWHQPGRDESGNYKPMISINNKFADASLANLVFNGNAGSPPPGCTPGASGNCAYDTIHTLNNREYFQSVSTSAQSSATSPFNGTTGAGFGTLANRPTTCTTSTESGAGVMYYATDTGAQGTVYTCSATNTWTVYYTPYTYPHPLVGASPPPPAPAAVMFVNRFTGQFLSSGSLR